jgi:enoyl-CoA hydratase/carnithine racemase
LAADVTARVEVVRDGAVLHITLADEPGRIPAYDGAAMHALGAAYAELDADPSLRVAVLASGSEKGFCVGADIAAVAGGGFRDAPYPELAEPLAAKPVIAAIEGLCLGGGMMIACGADLRIAGESARFGLPEARWNLPAQWLGALSRQVLPAHAFELAILADEQLPAARLAEMGWVNRVVPSGTAAAEARAWADRIAALAPRAVRHFKELIWQGTWSSPDDTLRRGHEQAAELMGMADTVEGGTAFAERRPPTFEDR